MSEAKSPAVDLIPANYSWLESQLDVLQDRKVSVLQTPGVGARWGRSRKCRGISAAVYKIPIGKLVRGRLR